MGNTMTTGGTTHNTLTALLVGLRSLRQHPGLAVMFLAATLAQGALQGVMVWALREVLITLSKPQGLGGSVLVVGVI